MASSQPSIEVGLSIQFEVRINSEAPIVAGRSGMDVLTAMLTFVRSHQDIGLRAGGMQRLDHSGIEHVEWVIRKLAVGDEVHIRVVDGGVPSEPVSVQREAVNEAERHERDYYEHLKRKYEPS